MYFADTPGTRARRLLGAAALTLLSAACTDDVQQLTAPDDALITVNAQGRPFYYYFGEQIALDVDPTEISVVSTLPPEASARAVLATLGVQVRGAQALPHAANHWTAPTRAAPPVPCAPCAPTRALALRPTCTA
jgi:hypothetical protein